MNNKDTKEAYTDLEYSITIEDEDTYRPLPDGLTIQKSDIEGLGLHSQTTFKSDHIFGITHYEYKGPKKNFKQQLVRTPLGGFLNHSEDPNCKVVRQSRDVYCLVAIKDISAEEELTVYYHMYGIN